MESKQEHMFRRMTLDYKIQFPSRIMITNTVESRQYYSSDGRVFVMRWSLVCSYLLVGQRLL